MTRRKNAAMYFRVTDEEKAIIEAIAKKRGLSASEHLRTSAMTHETKVDDEKVAGLSL